LPIFSARAAKEGGRRETETKKERESAGEEPLPPTVTPPTFEKEEMIVGFAEWDRVPSIRLAA
jgi:hypothetical protein